MPVILSTQVTEIWRTEVQGQPQQKVSETLIIMNKLGIVLTCNPSCAGGICRCVKVQGWAPSNKKKKKLHLSNSLTILLLPTVLEKHLNMYMSSYVNEWRFFATSLQPINLEQCFHSVEQFFHRKTKSKVWFINSMEMNEQKQQEETSTMLDEQVRAGMELSGMALAYCA
jgi:hypothetical protein